MSVEEEAGSGDFAPSVVVSLPETGRYGEVRLQWKRITPFDDDKDMGIGFPVRDMTPVFLAGRDAVSVQRLPEGEYVGVFIPPGGNNQLFHAAPEGVDTGRAGAILIMPLLEDAKAFCGKSGSYAVFVHSGEMANHLALRNIPSLLLRQDDLSRLIGSLVAARMAEKVGDTYEEVIKGKQLSTLQFVVRDGFKAFHVAVKKRKRSLWESLTGVEYGKKIEGYPGSLGMPPGAVPEILTFQELEGLRSDATRNVMTYMEEYNSRISALMPAALSEIARIRESSANVGQRQQRLKAVSPQTVEVITFIGAYLEELRENQAAMEKALGEEIVRRHIRQVEDHRRLLDVEADSTTDIELPRLAAASVLDIKKMVGEPASVKTPYCTLENKTVPIKPFSLKIEGKSVNLAGEAALKWTADRPDGSVVHADLLLFIKINDFKRVQAELVQENLEPSRCSSKWTMRENDLVATNDGMLKGKTMVRNTQYACLTFKYVCWKGWKQYWCKDTAKTKLFSSTFPVRLEASAKVDPAGRIDLEGEIRDRDFGVKMDPVKVGQIGMLADLLQLKTKSARFSENKDGLWLVGGMGGLPRNAAIACAINGEVGR